MNDETTNENNGIDPIIRDVIKLVGKEGCIGCYTSMKTRTPKIYAYQCKLFGYDIIEFVKGL